MTVETKPSLYDFSVKTIDGEDVSLAQYRGKTLLIVNVASQCGFTKQYEGLEHLYQKYRDRGLIVLGFPCNQFSHQEPGSAAEIKNFCETHYQITFPLFAKINVNGRDTHPLYNFLKQQKKGILFTKKIKWNFTKFLITSHGKVLKRYAPQTTPEKIAIEVNNLLVTT
jgi:glutathione peroxidase